MYSICLETVRIDDRYRNFKQDSILVNGIKEKVQLVDFYLLFQTMFVLFLFKLILSLTQPVILFHVAL